MDLPNDPTGPENQPEPQKRTPGPDRRKSVVDQRPAGTGLERRRGPGRRRSDFMKAAEEGEMTSEQFLFVRAIDAYKRVNQKPYPTWTEVLEVIRKLGYRKTAKMSLDISGCEDWTEAADAPAFAPKSAYTGPSLAGIRDE
jgi:hypothetical protein